MLESIKEGASARPERAAKVRGEVEVTGGSGEVKDGADDTCCCSLAGCGEDWPSSPAWVDAQQPCHGNVSW